MGNNQIAVLQDCIDKKRELEKKIFGVKTELYSPKFSNLSAKGMASADARARLKSFVYQQGNGSESGVPAARRADLAELKRNVERLFQEYNELKDEKQRLETELESLQSELMALDCSVDIPEITAQQEKIDKAKETVLSLTTTIEEQQSIIKDNQCAPPEELYLKRQDLLAERAIGKDITQELQTVDNEIADKEEKLACAGRLINDAKHALEGLTRKLNEANRQAETLEMDKKQMIIFFLNIEATKAELEYQAVAKDMADSYGRLYALDSILCQLSDNREKSFTGSNTSLFGIPAFGPSVKVKGGWLFNASACDILAMIAKEKSRLSAIGVQC